uniref:BZIP domain-containing protein n=1 Tax=Panagrolaimus sp. PS1159 TaxID=55785 RepID=A0AC35F6K3_9BILA
MLHQTPIPSGHFIQPSTQPFPFSHIPNEFFNQMENTPTFYNAYAFPQQYSSFDCSKLDEQATVSHFIPEKPIIPSSVKPSKTFKSPEEEKKSKARRERNNKAAQVSRQKRRQREEELKQQVEKLQTELKKANSLIDELRQALAAVKGNNQNIYPCNCRRW